MVKKIRWSFIRKCLILFLFVTLCFVSFKLYFENGEEYKSFNYDANLVKTCLNSINRGLDFFSNIEEDELVFDVLIGIRIVMEQTWLLSKYLTEKGGLKNLLEKLYEMIEKTNDLFDQIYDVLMKTQINNMNDIGHIISPNSWSHWTLESLCVNASLRYKNLNIIDENGGPVYKELNDCLKQYKHKCFIDEHCWNIMTEPGSQQYEISHQLMFIMLADKYGCNERLNYHIKKSGQGSLLNVQTTLCSNMYNETIEVAKLAVEYSWYRDIFVEFVAFCGMLGYQQFTNNKEWVRNMISWQYTNGCWSFLDFPDSNDEDTQYNKRRKRSDHLVGSNKCSLHMTTLALGALIVNVKNDFIQMFEGSRYNCGVD